MARIPVGIFPGETWGPRPRWALLPLLGAAGALAVADRPILPGARPGTAVAVTALKPVAGDDDPAPSSGLHEAGMPIEVLYGVPSARTAALWPRP